MLRRREFLLVAAAGVAGTTLGCRMREAVLKIPENADECFDLFRFFADPVFGLEQAKAGLGLTGEPRVLQASPTWRRHTFEDQKGLAERATLDNSGKDDGTGEYLFRDLHLLPPPDRRITFNNDGEPWFSRTHSEKVPVPVDRSPAAFTNLMPGQKEKEVTSYGFHPEEPIPNGIFERRRFVYLRRNLLGHKTSQVPTFPTQFHIKRPRRLPRPFFVGEFLITASNPRSAFRC